MFGYGNKHLVKDLAAVAGDDLTIKERVSRLRKANEELQANPKMANHEAVDLCIKVGCRHSQGNAVRELSDEILQTIIHTQSDLGVYATDVLAAIMVGKGDADREYDKFGEDAFAKNAHQMFLRSLEAFPQAKRGELGRRLGKQYRATSVAQYQYHAASGLETLCRGDGTLYKTFGNDFFDMAVRKASPGALPAYRGLKEAYANGYHANSTQADTILACLAKEDLGVVKAGLSAFEMLLHQCPVLGQTQGSIDKLKAIEARDSHGSLKFSLTSCLAIASKGLNQTAPVTECHRPMATSVPVAAASRALSH